MAALMLTEIFLSLFLHFLVQHREQEQQAKWNREKCYKEI